MIQNFAVFLTEAALQHFSKVLKSDQAIELSLKPSGCSGYANIISIISAENIAQQNLYKFQNIAFSVTPDQLKNFNNSVLDYKKDGLNYKLVIDNPNTKNHCGCGESFALVG